MPAPSGPQWFDIWGEKLSQTKSKDWRTSTPSTIYDWVNSSFFAPARFPTDTLRNMDSHLQDHSQIWAPNPAVAKRQKAFKRPKDAPESWQVDTSYPEHLHEMMKGTGVPEHVTVYHRGDIPESAEYASGSLDPNWPEEVRTGWRSKDPSINRGRLHIYLVPHQDILAEGGVENEVFFRRGKPLRKTPRTNRQQRRAVINAEDEF